MGTYSIRLTICIIAFCLLIACAGGQSSSDAEDLQSIDDNHQSISDSDEILASVSYFKENPEAAASFSMINMTFYGDTNTSRAVTWYTDPSYTGNDIRYAAVYDGEPDLLHMKVRSGEGGVAEDQASLYWHKAILDDLEPGVEYLYQVGDSGQDVWGPVKTIQIPAAQEDFTFLFVSDTHVKHEKSAGVAAQTFERAFKTASDIRFVVHTGDFVDDASEPEQWRLALEAFQGFMPNIPIAIATGNHDNNNGIFNRHFNLPAPKGCNTKSGVYYSFSYGSVHFVVLNTNERSDEYGYLSEKQVEWMRGDVAAAREKGARQVFVVMHRGLYSLGENASDERIALMRSSVSDLFDELNVDLVLQGHDHISSRTKTLQNKAVDENGAVYINAGPSCRSSDEPNDGLPSDYFELFDFYTKRQNDLTYQNFCVICVNSESVSITIYETYQSEDAPVYVVDEYTLPFETVEPEAGVSDAEQSSAA